MGFWNGIKQAIKEGGKEGREEGQAGSEAVKTKFATEDAKRKPGVSFGDLEFSMYEEDEMSAVETHIEQYFGEYESVMHEIYSPDIHLDIVLIPPTEKRPRFILVTMGVGAYRMDVPEELRDAKLERMELVSVLPADWNVHSEEDQDYWPIGTLKKMGRYPLENKTWLGWGHSVGFGDKDATGGTDFAGYVLVSPLGIDGAGKVRELPDGDEVNFYQVIPVYQDELTYKRKNGTEALLQKFQEAFGEDWDGALNPGRPCVV